jgi:hypothetical protein
MAVPKRKMSNNPSKIFRKNFTSMLKYFLSLKKL